jgi:hypothetical protein
MREPATRTIMARTIAGLRGGCGRGWEGETEAGATVERVRCWVGEGEAEAGATVVRV